MPSDLSAGQRLKIYGYALLAAAALLGLFFAVVSAVSGWKFALNQFSNYWYFLVSLAAGFGAQIGLYVYLRILVRLRNAAVSGKTVAVTGTSSFLSMVSCCAHYLANIIPIIGVAGAISVIAQYQVQLFWAGLAFNLFGIAFIITKIIKFRRHLP